MIACIWPSLRRSEFSFLYEIMNIISYKKKNTQSEISSDWISSKIVTHIKVDCCFFNKIDMREKYNPTIFLYLNLKKI